MDQWPLLNDPMVSKLEDALLRRTGNRARLRACLFKYLDGRWLRALRASSRVLHDLVDHYPEQTFQQLFVLAPWPSDRDLGSFKAVAPFCRSLTVVVGQPAQQNPHHSDQPRGSENLSIRSRWRKIRQALTISKRSSDSATSTASTNDQSTNDRSSALTHSTESSIPGGSKTAAGPPAQYIWISIFAKCKNVQTIVLNVHGDPGWPGRTEVESALVDVRVALERVHLPAVRSVRLTPIHAMAIFSLRWSGLGTYGPAAPSNAITLWQNVHTLDLQLQNPFLAKRKLTSEQKVMFTKIMQEYLRSFAGTLKRLRFTWMEDDGPSPITLDLEEGLEGEREPIKWAALEEVWLGNIALPHRTIRLLPERIAKEGVRLKTLRITHRLSRAVFDDEKAWVDVLLKNAQHGIVRKASSIYSQ